MLPAAHRVAVLANAPDPFSKPFLEQVGQAGSTTGLEIDPVLLRDPSQLDAAFAAISAMSGKRSRRRRPRSP
jgi:putative ABC transport system substrate-binding protein